MKYWDGGTFILWRYLDKGCACLVFAGLNVCISALCAHFLGGRRECYSFDSFATLCPPRMEFFDSMHTGVAEA